MSSSLGGRLVLEPPSFAHFRTAPFPKMILSGSLERVIAQVDMEEGVPNNGRPDLRVTVPDPNDGYGQGHRAGTGGGARDGNGAGGAGWTDMFQGMTVEVRASCAGLHYTNRCD